MTNRTCSVLLALLAITLMAGCAVDLGSEGARIGEAEGALETGNALSPNALHPNALHPNALHPSALSSNALDPSALDPSALSAIQDPGIAGDLSRQHLKYAVGCALSSAQSFSFSWTDNLGVVHDETYWGMLGLAPDWAMKPLDTRGQRWVSACLAARTNDYGVQVMISVRGPCKALDQDNSPEASTFTEEEGAFWGNLYAEHPALYACHVAANDDNSRSQHRDCAAGHIDPATGDVVPCGMIQLLGTCDVYCLPTGSQGFSHLACWSDPSRKWDTGTLQPITVALQ